MVSFVKKRLQVFVSSTYTDLIQERQAAVEAILKAGHIPAGMELFTAGDESQLEVINQWIDESDIYLLILGSRYGSIEPITGKSYTHLEYEYALAQNKPLFACVIKDSAIDKKIRENGRDVVEMENPQKLKEFRSFVFTKIIKEWEDSKDIKLVIYEALIDFSRNENLIGWVRSSEEINVDTINEIARLSKENADLRTQVEAETINGLSFDDLKMILEHEGLLGFFEKNKHILIFDGIHVTRTLTGAVVLELINGDLLEGDWYKMERLCALGLVSLDNGTARLLSAGRVFLNKLDLWKLKQQNSKTT